MPREVVTTAKKVVIKVGSSLLTTTELKLNRKFIKNLAKQLKSLQDKEIEFLLVTSGAVAAGLPFVGQSEKPTTFTDMHVMAAIGQIHLFRAYDEILSPLGFRCAQVLLTAEELSHRTTYLNARSTLRRLLDLGITPIINENDAIAISERRFGDNDRLAAELANLIEANLLIILSDVAGIYTDFTSKTILKEAKATDTNLNQYINEEQKSKLGSGGMATKLQAANFASNCGTHTIISDGKHENILERIIKGEEIGTLLTAPDLKMSAKERWLSSCAKAKGSVVLDEGAVSAVKNTNSSLLPIGVVEVIGRFRRGDIVSCVDSDKKVIAQGMINYDSHEVAALCKKHSKEISNILGYVIADEIIHRDNLVTLN